MNFFLNVWEHLFHLIHVLHDLIEHPEHGKYILYGVLISGIFIVLFFFAKEMSSGRMRVTNQPLIILPPKPLSKSENRKIQMAITSLAILLLAAFTFFIYVFIKRISA